MFILVPDRRSADDIAALSELPLRDPWPSLVITDGPPEMSVARARERHGGQPIGYLARSEAEALEAIGAGADEALCLASIDARGFLLLVDRTAQRASLRREQENVRASAAQSARLAALGMVVAGVAHEINNPLSAMLLYADLLKNMLGPLTEVASPALRTMDARQVLEELVSLGKTIAEIVRDLKIYARPEEIETPQLVHVSELVDQVLRVVGGDIQKRGHIERDYTSDLPAVLVPRSRVVQVLTNVLLNAAQALQEVERPVHRVRITVRADTESLAVSISDTGPGIPEESLERIFDPFFTTKPIGTGTGLGLSISRSILRRLGGDLVVESLHGEGATFVAFLPLPKGDAASPKAVEARAKSSTNGPAIRVTVLAVDDDPRLRRAYPRILRERYNVLVAADGQEAIDLLASGAEVDVVLSDLAMPEMDGRMLLDWLMENRPNLAKRTVFFTAGSGSVDYTDFLARVPNTALEKPASRDELFQAIERALETWPISVR